jgi:hypothetical protein
VAKGEATRLLRDVGTFRSQRKMVQRVMPPPVLQATGSR